MFSCVSSSRREKLPNVLGVFYPEKDTVLNKEIKSFIDGAKVELPNCSIVGIISPHAGYRYSGSTAGYSFKALSTNNYAKYERIFIIGPSHFYQLSGAVVPLFDCYVLPNGRLPIDKKVVEELAKTDYIKLSNKEFEKEHSVEVELPFINYKYPKMKIVPIIVGSLNKTMITEIANNLKKYIDNSLFVISSDLSHYKTSAVCNKMDTELADIVVSKNSELFLKKNLSGEIEACGLFPISVFLKMIEKNDTIKAKLLKLSDSGSSAFNEDRVVGYGSFVFYKELKKK
jgi:AmmeMemoRadiSam system protein B